MQDTKKVAGELLVELEKKGVTFETVDGKLKYKDSKGNFTENSKEKVKKYKEEIKTMESYRFLKRNIDGNFKSCIISLTESTTPLIFMRNPVGFSYS